MWEPALCQNARGGRTRGQRRVDGGFGEAGEARHLRGEANVDVARALCDVVSVLAGAVDGVRDGALAPVMCPQQGSLSLWFKEYGRICNGVWCRGVDR